MHHTILQDRRKELTFFDENSARAFTKLLPEGFVHQLRNLWEGENAHLLGLSETALRRELRRRGKDVGPADNELRFRFWYEFNRVQDEMLEEAKMNMTAILGRTVPKETFYKFYITDPYKLAWLLCPPADYAMMLESNLLLAQSKIAEILETPHVEASGFAHTDLIDRIIKIMESLHNKTMALKYRRAPGRPRQQDEREVPAEVPKSETPEERLLRMRAEVEARRSSQVEP